MSTRQLYIEGLEHHLELIESQTDLQRLGGLLATDMHQRTGVEDVEGAKEGLRVAFNAAKWIGGTSYTLFSKLLSSAGDKLLRSFGANETLIKKLLSKFSTVEEHELSISKTALATITCEGDLADLSRDMDVMLRALESFERHSKDVLAYLDKQLLTAKKLKGVSTTDALFAVVEEYDKLEHPEFKLPHHSGNKWSSDVLPGGKVWEYEHPEKGAPKYSMNGDTPAGAGTSATMSKSEVSSLLTKLDKVNAVHKRVKQSYDNYLSFLKSWADMVKAVDGNLSKLENVSKTAHGEAEKILAGNSEVLAFYSGFTPRVVSYTDKYIHGVLGVFA